MTEEIKEVQEQTPVVQEESATSTAPAAPAAPAGPDLNVSDLMAVKSVFEVAISRGAFKPTELEAVGKIFNKLNSFLEAVSKKEA